MNPETLPMFQQGKKDRFGNTTINYFLIDQALLYYTGLNYEYIDVPWLCQKETSEITRPSEALPLYIDNLKKELVGSGEQSFLEIRHTLPIGSKFVCTTPCFRDEMILSDAKRQYFLKVELIKILRSEEEGYSEILQDAINFFNSFKMTCGKCRIVKTNIGHDIFLGNYEIGSYGVRKHENFIWAYGTGIAEPRFSIALNSWGNND